MAGGVLLRRADINDDEVGRGEEVVQLLGGDDEDLAQAIVDSGDGVVVAGQTRSNNNGDVGPARGNSDAWVVKLKE